MNSSFFMGNRAYQDQTGFVESIGVFGSYVRSEQRPECDLGILVSFRETPRLLKFIELENFLSDTLGIKVDLVMQDSLKPHRRTYPQKGCIDMTSERDYH